LDKSELFKYRRVKEINESPSRVNLSGFSVQKTYPMQIFIETPRLLLREIVPSDVEGIFELDSDPDVHTYLGATPITSLAEAEAIINYIRKQYEDNGIGRWAVIEKATNAFVGWSGLKYETVVREDMDYYDLGYRLKKKFWGKGMATETALASLEYGFRVLELKEIYAAAHLENLASNKILQKVGLTFFEVFDYDEEPHNWYRISREDWQANNPMNNQNV